MTADLGRSAKIIPSTLNTNYMSTPEKPYVKLDEIKEVKSANHAEQLRSDGWIFLGYYTATFTPDHGSSPEKNFQEPRIILGKPSAYQDL